MQCHLCLVKLFICYLFFVNVAEYGVVVFSSLSRRPPWSLCQGRCGRFRAMPLYRHCEEHTWPQVESTLWPVSPRDFDTSHAVMSDICFQRQKKKNNKKQIPSLFIEYPPPSLRLNLITNSSLPRNFYVFLSLASISEHTEKCQAVPLTRPKQQQM